MSITTWLTKGINNQRLTGISFLLFRLGRKQVGEKEIIPTNETWHLGIWYNLTLNPIREGEDVNHSKHRRINLVLSQETTRASGLLIQENERKNVAKFSNTPHQRERVIVNHDHHFCQVVLCVFDVKHTTRQTRTKKQQLHLSRPERCRYLSG